MDNELICSGCGCELHVVASSIRVEGDTSPDTPTKVYDVQVLRCVNRACPHPDEREIQHELHIGITAEEA